MTAPPRRPRVFAPDDPDLVADPPPQPGTDVDAGTAATAAQEVAPSAGSILGGLRRRGRRWGLVLLAALAGAASLSVLAWLADFVSVALTRSDWIGWATLTLLLLAAFAALMLVLRELTGLARVARLTRLRSEIAATIAAADHEAASRDQAAPRQAAHSQADLKDAAGKADRKEPDLGRTGPEQAGGLADRKRERRAAQRIAALYAGRRSLAWSLRRFREHMGDVHDPGEILALAEREIMLPLDAEARRMVTRSAKRVATVTALSPMPAIAMAYVLVENLHLLRSLATLYGARPGTAGLMRLARMVVAHIVATGGVAMTDDLLGQFLGHDLIRRLSRRLGEGALNGALTARIGMTALEAIRPMPFRIANPPRMRDVLAEALKPIISREPSPGRQPDP